MKPLPSWYWWKHLLLFSSLLAASVDARDKITASQPLVGNQILVSSNGSFKLGIFSPQGSSERYLGIWFGKVSVKTVVWVANRDKPIANTSKVGILGIHHDLVLNDEKGTPFWSSGTRNGSNSSVAQLLDTGNLVLTETKNGIIYDLWQSFDCPSDTMLAGMKIGLDLTTGLNRSLTSWASTSDPSRGAYQYLFDLHGIPQLFIRKKSNSSARIGFWTGLTFSNRPPKTADGVFRFEYVADLKEVYYTYQVEDTSTITRVTLDPSGKAQRFIWEERTNSWNLYWEYPGDQCDGYAVCGANGICNTDVTTCECLPGFVNNHPEKTNIRDGTNRCTRRASLSCTGGDWFRKVPGLKLPDSSNATADMTKGLEQCRKTCLDDCSCMGYALADIEAGSGCVMWFGQLLDVKQFATGGQDLYLRLAASELEDAPKKNSLKKKAMAIVLSTVASALLLLLLSLTGYCILKKKKRQVANQSRGEDVLLPSFDLEAIATATGGFCITNKLGHGGFGSVYLGKLDDGKEIAVKRLSKKSQKGSKEFTNEITLIAKLQHRNLVKLLGCCVEGEERMLIYEYLPNRSLDSFIFDEERGSLLDWQMRVGIVMGIARGVLYLHHDSRLKIVHRDLKASNVLLDKQMNPKISDFGAAKILEEDQIKDSTSIVVGTYGYMPPEYVTKGIFSMKSDVFSFGVIVLEIMSGVKNKVVHQAELPLSLQGYAWKLWNEGNISLLVDTKMGLSWPNLQIMRCLHIALLCVQECVEDRPHMSSVVLMLGSESIKLPPPNKPGFFTTLSFNQPHGSSSSACEVTITDFEGR